MFGNVGLKRKALLAEIHVLDNNLKQNWDDTIHAEWEHNKKELRQVETWENDLLCQKARMDWTKHGDRNTKFYHAFIKERQKRQLTQINMDNGEVTASASTMGALATEFFSNTFPASLYHLDRGLFEGVQPAISFFEDT